MLYSKMLKIDRQFESAVNLGLDINKHNKVKEYIPTEASLKILYEYLMCIEKDLPEKATVLIGPYGKGKSHLLLILSAVVSMNLKDDKNKQIIYELIDTIEAVDKHTADLIKKMINSKKRLLPVIINGGYGTLQQSFLIALKEALERECIDDIMPETYYELALGTIKNWQEKYVTTAKQFWKSVSELGYSKNQIIVGLKNYDVNAYDVFCKIHQEVCAGARFNPLINMDIVQMYKIINKEICSKYEYTGMLVIFDEFSKFLDNSKNNQSGELKILQDFAEFANRTQKEQVHLLCVTHKPIGYYTQEMSREKALTYRTVEGRFKEVYFVTSSDNNYQLIQNAIKRDKTKFEKYLEENKNFFEQMNQKICDLGVFAQKIDIKKQIVNGCFPLHPLTVFSAIRISELVAQNERTLFTFLASHQKNTLRTFIETNTIKNRTLTIDYLYDYFKDCFKKELSNEIIINTYAQVEALLIKVLDKPVQAKILKTIALINMINEPSVIKATDNVLAIGVDETEDIFREEINELVRNHYIFKRKSDGVYVCLNSSSIDIQSKINEIKQMKVKNIDERQILTEILPLGYTLPKQFNDDYEMIRFFRNEYLTYDEIMTIKSVESLLEEKKCDGIVGYLVYNEEDDIDVLTRKIGELNDERLVIYIPDEPIEVRERLKEYIAIKYLEEDTEIIENDAPALEQLSIYRQDIVVAIENYLQDYYKLDNKSHRWMIGGSQENPIIKKNELSKVISNICRRVYHLTPVIGNELINKNVITGAILVARNKLTQILLNGEIPCSKGNSPDVTIGRALLLNHGVLENKVDDKGLRGALEEIDLYVKNADGQMKNIGELYDRLQKPPYGMRKGVIPVYLAVYFSRYKEHLVFYNKKREVQFDFDTLKMMDKNPTDYYIYLESGIADKIKYLSKINVVMGEEIEFISFHNQCIKTLETMQKWYKGLPKCSREYEFEGDLEAISKRFKKYILRFDVNPREFLFETLPYKIVKNNDLEVCIKSFMSLKEQYDEYFDNLILELIKISKEVLVPQYKGELGGALKRWYQQLGQGIEEQVFDMEIKHLIDCAINLEVHDEKHIIEEIGFILTGLSIEDWDLSTIQLFKERLPQVIEDVRKRLDNNQAEDVEGTQIILMKDGEVKRKQIGNTEISPLGETLLSNLIESFDEYGDAIETSEKMSVLLKLLGHFI